MKNPMLYYGVIALGIIALAFGIYFLASGGHTIHLRTYAALGAGVILLVGGIVGMIVMKPRAA